MSEEQELQVTTQQLQVFGTGDPVGTIDRARVVSAQLAPIVERGKLYNIINGKKYVRCEGWTSMAAMLGCFPHVDHSRRIATENNAVQYESRVTLKTPMGNLIGSGEAICSSEEKNWRDRDEFAIKSMAQTRAVGKACRLCFSWIMTLAGFEATPAEEVVSETESFHKPSASNKPITEKQLKWFHFKVKKSGISHEDVKQAMVNLTGKTTSRDMTMADLDTMIKFIDEQLTPPETA